MTCFIVDINSYIFFFLTVLVNLTIPTRGVSLNIRAGYCTALRVRYDPYCGVLIVLECIT